VTFDLVVWPVDRALTLDEAVAEVGRLGGMPAFGRGHDRRLDPFIGALEKRYPGLRGRGPGAPFEFDVHRRHVFIGIPWSYVTEVVEAVGAAAHGAGVAVFDPQRMLVGLPAPFAEAPMTAEGVEPHVASADDAFAAIRRGAATATGYDTSDVQRAISEQFAAAGFHTMRPLDFGVTPDLEAEVIADPTRVPVTLQTPMLRAELIAALGEGKVGERHRALGQLAGWDPDPAVAEALRPILASDDVFAASQAAAGLARQRDLTDLPAVLDLVHRLSPADGGTTEAMLIPLRAALALAALAGPPAVEGVKSRARTWRGARKVRHQPWEHVFDQELDELLGDS
jgi:hypothetical protein